jgi:cation diffusion facilitator family transporter
MNSIRKVYREGRAAALSGLSISLGLGLVKFLGGYFGGSFALLSDAAHSLVDALISAALYGALVLAQRPPDREHPYGHGRVEALAATAVSVVLMALALAIAWEAVTTIGRAPAPPAGFTLLIAAAGTIVQEGLYRYMSRVARRTGSRALLATAWDYRLDAFGSVAVLAGVALAAWGGPSWHWADHVAALAVVATILWVGARLFWENVQALMDRQAEPELVQTVRREALAVPGVRGVEKLRVRPAGLEYLVDIHVEVDPDQTVRAGHEIAHAVKDRVIRQVTPVRDVLVHIEPSPGRPETRTPAAANAST